MTDVSPNSHFLLFKFPEQIVMLAKLVTIKARD